MEGQRLADQEVPLTPIKRARLYESAVEQIKSLILENHYKPGDRLPSERELAERLQISRPAMREALKILNIMGFVEIRVGNGTYVREVSFAPYVESVVDSISSRLNVQEEKFLKLIEVRKILEMEMARLACLRISPRNLERIEQCVRQMEANLKNRDDFITWGIRFHREIAEATGNEILVLIWDSLWDLIRRSQYRDNRLIVRSPKMSLEGHKKIYQALLGRKPLEAWAAMEEHLNKERAELLKALKKPLPLKKGSSRIRGKAL